MAFAPSKGKKYADSRKGAGKMQLSSMMDMMTIILLFLIKSYSATGALVQPSQHLELPSAKRDMEPKKVVAILVSTNYGVLEDIEEEIRSLSPPDEINSESNAILPGLSAYLAEKRDFRISNNLDFKGEVTVQCGMDVPYNWLLKVINTCGQNEFTVIDFVVKKIES